ncbi:hypothetical protein KI387_029274, partial [Taxus chinensis]
EEIGRGAFGIIYRCVNTESGGAFACKTIRDADSQNRDCLYNEIEILKSVRGHHGIVQFHDFHEDEDSVWLLMELCSGGDLYERIAEKKKFREDEAAAVLKSLMEAIRFCHSKGIVHRDLKPENILFADDSSFPNRIKLADFGEASFCSSGEKMRGLVGTPYYVAPEVVQEKYYDEKVDVWSAGVILYIMLAGFAPFNGETTEQIFEAVQYGRLPFTSQPWLLISQSAKDLIRQMLCRDVGRRFTAHQEISFRAEMDYSDVSEDVLVQLTSGEDDGHLVQLGLSLVKLGLKKEEITMKKKGTRRSAAKNGGKRSAGKKGRRKRISAGKNGSRRSAEKNVSGIGIARERTMKMEERAWKWNRETKKDNERETKSHNMQKPCCNLSPATPDPCEKSVVQHPAIGIPRLRTIT